MGEGRKKIIDLGAGIKNPALLKIYKFFEKPIEKIFGLAALNEAYERLHAFNDDRNFFERAIEVVPVRFEADPDEIAKIPRVGPLVVVSNHPLGCVDGIALGAILTRVRPDAKMILNSMLSPMDEINACSISVNPFGGNSATAQNVSAMKEIINPNSLEIRKNCYVEKFVATLPKLSYLQFQRIGYFNIDSESTPDNLVFNRTVGLKDTWSKINK